MLTKLVSIIVPIMLCFSCMSQDSEWFKYEPAIVSLVGVIHVKESFGPPGYGEDKLHDARIKYVVLDLSNSINVRGEDGRDINTTTHLGVQALQLVDDQQLLDAQAIVGQKVRVTGSLFERQSGHHLTDVLLSVKAIAIER